MQDWRAGGDARGPASCRCPAARKASFKCVDEKGFKDGSCLVYVGTGGEKNSLVCAAGQAGLCF